jgi:GNAT superfamily N-acetyltransferase
VKAAVEARFLIRAARAADAARLAELAGELGYPSTTAQLEQRLQAIEGQGDHAVFVAETQPQGEHTPQLAGWLHACLQRALESDSAVEIKGLVVDARWRGEGAGRVLMERAEQWAREQRCPTVVLRSNVIREGAHVFYERLGYRIIKTQRVFRKDL